MDTIARNVVVALIVGLSVVGNAACAAGGDEYVAHTSGDFAGVQWEGQFTVDPEGAVRGSIVLLGRQEEALSVMGRSSRHGLDIGVFRGEKQVAEFIGWTRGSAVEGDLVVESDQRRRPFEAPLRWEVRRLE